MDHSLKFRFATFDEKISRLEFGGIRHDEKVIDHDNLPY